MATCINPTVIQTRIQTSSSDSDIKSLSSRLNVAGFRDGKATIVLQNNGPCTIAEPDITSIVSSPDFKTGEYQTGQKHCSKLMLIVII